MSPFDGQRLLFGDIHNHCDISYGHGSLEDALKNARERLDFVSVTGHAHWPDMPEPDERIQYIIDFHLEGFARLKEGWPKMMETLRTFNVEDEFVIFPGFEVHFCATGDRNMIYRDLDGEILYPADLKDLHRQLRQLRARGIECIAQPHHLGYRRGTRGIDWESFDPEFAPFVEMLSMHGCSESNENTRPFLHSMGPSDWESTIHYGLRQGHVFGFSGGTDHHSAHPGSYGHGMTGLWADSGRREDIWKAFRQRRMFALTGDRMDLRFAVNGVPMGGIAPRAPERRIEFSLAAGGPIDCVDLLRNGELIKRFSQYEMPAPAPSPLLHSKLHLELGWGARHESCHWQAELGLSDGEILSVEPRFRGREVVSPVEGRNDGAFYEQRVIEKSARAVKFQCVTRGNPNNSTPTMQGMCLEFKAPRSASIVATLNGQRVEHPVERLLEGARSGRLGDIDSPAWRFHRIPEPHEWNWSGEWTDHCEGEDSYYLRVRQRNDQWAWASPVFFRYETAS